MTNQISIAMNNLKRVYVRYQAEIESAALGALRSGWWLNGTAGKRFAQNFASYVGVSDCILVANGTDALELALSAALKVRGTRGAEVILAANAGGYASCACRHNNVIPHYADIDRESQLISLPAIVAAASENTSAIVVTHLYGGVVDVRALREELAKVGLSHIPIVEDCAQAHGAHINGEKAGSLGDVATFSFYPTKNLGAMGDGGAVLTSDTAIAAHVRQLQQYGWNSKYQIGLPDGRNSRMDEVQAAALDVALTHLDERNHERRAILDQYKSTAKDRIRFVDGGPGAVAHLAVALCDERDAFRNFMSSRGIDTDVHYPILDCDQKGWASLPMKGADELPVSRASVSALCSVPCYPELTREEVNCICASLAEWETT